MILVVCAVADELGGFARGGVDVVTVGVGPVEAAIGALRALSARPSRSLAAADPAAEIGGEQGVSVPA